MFDVYCCEENSHVVVGIERRDRGNALCWSGSDEEKLSLIWS